MKLCTPERTVLAIIGDGAAMYSPQALWSAVEMRIPVIVIVMSNDGYAILDRASAAQGLSGVPQWGRFSAISPATVAKGFGCPSVELGRISDVVTLVQQKASEKMGALPLLIDFSCS
jgi:benzoylformate decarboxylase